MGIRELLRSVDWLLTSAALLLVSIGLAMIFSTTSDATLYSDLFVRQLTSLAIALVAYISISLLPYHKLRRYALLLYGLGIVSLLIVSQLGSIIRGTTSRFEFYGFQLQPSEFMKVAIVVLISWLFARNQSTQTTLLTGLTAGLATIIIVIEPDLGEAALIVMLWAIMVIYIGTPWPYIALGLVVGGVGLIGAWHWLFADYQKSRIINFLDPTSDPLGAGYNVMQSIVALGSGGFLGRGLGHGPQSQLQFLPEQHTDFILASIGEELGFVGIILVVGLYSILLWRLLRIANTTMDTFGHYLAVGVYVLLLISFFVSAGMNMGLLPVTGIPLPLVSYGGSSLLATFILLGIAQSVHLYNRWHRKPPGELTHL